MRRISVASLSNQNISSALNVATYTADEDRELLVRLFVDQVAGGGTYYAYLTIQRAGAGSAFEMQPRTAASVVSGVTAIGLSTIAVPVLNTDVVKVYVIGLSTDTTTPDVTVEFWEADYTRPITQGQHEVALTATGSVGINWDGIENPTTTVTLSGTTIKDVTDTIEVSLADGAINSGNITPDAIAQLEALASSNDRTFRRGDHISTTLATLGHTWASGATMRLTMKPIASYAKDADNAATVGLLLTNPAASSADGLVLLNKVVKTSSGDRGKASLTRTDGSNTAVSINGSAGKDIAPGKYAVDVQVVEADGDVVTIVPTCTWTIEADVTRTTS